MASLKKTTQALEILKNYEGENPYILMLKRDMFVYEDPDAVGDFQIDYILQNYNYKPKTINRVTKIPEWYGIDRQEKWNTEFIPQKLLVCSIFGETDTSYSCYVQYRQSVPPVICFLPKKAIINNLFVNDYNKVEVDFDRYDRLSNAKSEGRKLKPHQKEAVKFLLSRKKCMLCDEQGLGKLEPVSSLIPTPNGFKKMGEINPGDQVFSSDGKIYNVLKTFDHKNKEIYRVTFNDGTYVDCGLDHLWSVRTINHKRRGSGWHTKSLKELIDSGLQWGNKKRIEKYGHGINKFEIPVCEPVEYNEKKYLIHPYILGMCIGDGNLCNGHIHISIPDIEYESAERILSFLPEYMTLTVNRSASCPRYSIIHKKRASRNDFHTEIKRLGLNIHGNNKFIPEEYKNGSIEQRKELLSGLLDSDGSIVPKNKIGYYTNSEKLANDVVELVNSLGGIARIHSYKRVKNNKEITEYHVMIQVKFNPFKLQRKHDKYTTPSTKYCRKYIVSAEYVRNEDAKCLMVDSIDHTYLTSRNYIVTHNTTSLSVAAIEGNFDSVLIICPASLKTNWKTELSYYVDERYITVVDGFSDKNKKELEKFLGYGIGKSGKKKEELAEEAKQYGKWQDNRFVIVNYDILDDFYTLSSVRSESAVKELVENNPMLKYIYNKKACIIMDEVHILTDSSSKRYKIINNLIKRGKPESIYLATGTPVTNNPLNLYYLLALIENEITSDYNYYINTYCEAKKFPAKGERERCEREFLRMKGKSSWYDLTNAEKEGLKEYISKHAKMITTATGSDNLDELQEKISHVYLRRTKDILDLPPKHLHEIFYDLTVDQKKEYNRLWEEYEAEQKQLDQGKELNKDLLEGSIYRSYLANIMVPKTIELANSIILKGNKVVIACCFDEELNSLREYYKDKCVIYNGKMGLKEKDAAKDKFMTDDNCMVFIGNVISAGKGITLIKSHDLIFNSFNYSNADCKQVEDRIHRIGQTHDCDIYYQFFRETQCENVWNIVLRKQRITEALIKKEGEK